MNQERDEVEEILKKYGADEHSKMFKYSINSAYSSPGDLNKARIVLCSNP